MGRRKSRKCLFLFGLRDFKVGRLWTGKPRNSIGLRRSDTGCGNVDPHFRRGCYGSRPVSMYRYSVPSAPSDAKSAPPDAAANQPATRLLAASSCLTMGANQRRR